MSALDFDPKDLSISKFKAMLGKVVEINDEVKNNLSTDQKYRLRAYLAVQQG